MSSNLSKKDLLSLIAEHIEDYWIAEANGWSEAGEIEETIHRLMALLAKVEACK